MSCRPTTSGSYVRQFRTKFSTNPYLRTVQLSGPSQQANGTSACSRIASGRFRISRRNGPNWLKATTGRAAVEALRASATAVQRWDGQVPTSHRFTVQYELGISDAGAVNAIEHSVDSPILGRSFWHVTFGFVPCDSSIMFCADVVPGWKMKDWLSLIPPANPLSSTR